MFVEFPFQLNRRGETATTADIEVHVRNLIEQLLFTNPGERVNRPTFGTGLNRFIFAGADQELASSLHMLVQSALQQFLGEYIKVEAVDIKADEGRLFVTVVYVLIEGQKRVYERFEQERSL